MNKTASCSGEGRPAVFPESKKGDEMPEWFLEHSLIIMLVAAALFTFFWLFGTRGRLGMPAWAAPVFSVVHVVLGVAFVKVFAFLESAGHAQPGAMSLFGAVFFMPAAYWAGAKLFKRPAAEVFDIFSICMIFTLMCARVNCLVGGCCLGRQISSASMLRWPVREAELVYYAVFLILMVPRVIKKKTGGKVYPLYMLSYGCVRAVLECFRESSSPGLLHIAHIWAFISLTLGASIYIEISKSRDRKSFGRKNK